MQNYEDDDDDSNQDVDMEVFTMVSDNTDSGEESDCMEQKKTKKLLKKVFSSWEFLR